MMSSIRQSAAWWCFVPDHFTPEEFVRTLAEIGYAAIDLAPVEYLPLAAEHGLAISAIAAHQPLTRGFNRREQHESLERQVTASLRHAEKWRIPNLICFSGNRDGLADETGALNAAEGLTRVAPLAEQAGVTLILELLNSKVDHPDYQADHTAWGLRVCRAVASPRVKLLYDIYHMQIMEGDVIRTIQTAHPFFAHYHTAGNPGRNDLDASQELYYPAILRAIKDTGYGGYVAHEFIPKGEPRAALQQAFALGAQYL